MLYVYTYPIPKPTECFDLSTLPLEEFVESILAIVNHQKTGTLWFGYLDGWMLNPREEVLIRKAIRKFKCIVVSHFPLAFSQAWKNECDTIYMNEPNGHSNTHNNGSALHN
jgi:hypothetical protein